MHRSLCKYISFFLASALAVTALTACHGLPLENKTEMVEEYTREQAMILVANARNRYGNVYGEGIWELSVGSDGATFDKLLVQDVKEYLETIKLILLLAEEEGVSLSSVEREAVRQMSERYYSLLTEEDIAYIGCSMDDVQKMYTDIATADKLLQSITADVDRDLSDSEAKVIKISQIVTSDEKKALAILKRVKIDGADFSSLAVRYTEADDIDITLLRDDNDNSLIARTAFRLEEGEISNILCVDGLYYIIKCVDDYAREETLSRKATLVSAMNTKAVQDVLVPYGEEHTILFTDRFWSEIDFSEPTLSTVDNFFDIYDMFK